MMKQYDEYGSYETIYPEDILTCTKLVSTKEKKFYNEFDIMDIIIVMLLLFALLFLVGGLYGST